MDAGLYESVLSVTLISRLQQTPLAATIGSIDSADQPHVLGQYVGEVVRRRLEATPNPTERLDILNRLLEALEAGAALEPPARQLLALTDTSALSPMHIERPTTPLAEAALLTNARDEPSLASELRAEIASADRVDLICAFVRWHGVRLLEQALAANRQRNVPFRVVTTTYLGSTERRALDRLAREFGAEISVQYDAQRTRLHAKAWLFRRRTGFDTAYVGSSNLSHAALLDGVEWNVRLAQPANPALIAKFEATFDSYWSDPTFERYDPDIDGDRLDDALLEARGMRSHDRVTISLSGLQVRAYPYQQTMLDEIQAEREVHDRHRNLVVAATGTGKTVVAALDYQRLCEEVDGERPSLLFVAHRREILEQSLRTYREVLGDANFGETWVGGQRPERWRHVFASVQSLASYGASNLPHDHFDVVVIDEFHHAQAPTYRSLLDHLEPAELLGLTATPERGDGVDVRQFFDGRTATELRLWDAIGADLLVPFHYFAAADGTDLRRVTWRRGRGYDEGELDRVYTGNDARARIVLRELRDKVTDLDSMRALGFCVSVNHARYMATVFREAGLPAAALSGESSETERRERLDELRAGSLKAIFAVDLFNEGLDIPEIDTVLLLRPTESSTIFLQQLGRGLRRTRDKAVLTVLDFVGLHNRQFSFAARYRALTGLPQGRLLKAIEQGFPFLPSGCQIILDRQSEASVLENVRSQVSRTWKQIVADARDLGDVDLSTFLEDSGLSLASVITKGRSWTRLRREANLPTPDGGPLEPELLNRVRALSHVDDRDRAEAYRRLLLGKTSGGASENEQQMAQMLFFSLWPGGGGHASIGEGLAALEQERAALADFQAVVDIAFDEARYTTTRLTGRLRDLPLRVHAHYQREEVLAGLGYATLNRVPRSFMEGVCYVRELNVDALFVTLRKSEADYSPTTMYRDFPIDQHLFHWESQSTTTLRSPTGQRYLSGGSTILLFVREAAQNELGTAPYLFLGEADLVSHSGERPIAITWRLTTPMPMDFFQRASVAAA
jgi:superfamily II DNA or RNA helicase/HKD family nuclease